MSAIVLQQLFCFMTHNIKHIHRDWFGLPWPTLCLATLTLVLLICHLIYPGVSKYWIFSHFHWHFSWPNTMWIFVTITLGHFPLVLPTLWWYNAEYYNSGLFFPITEIGSSWPFLYNQLTQHQSTFKLPHFHMMDHHPYIWHVIIYNLNWDIILIKINVL